MRSRSTVSRSISLAFVFLSAGSLSASALAQDGPAGGGTKLLPIPEQIATPAEQAQFSDLMMRLSKAEGPEATIKLLDDELTRLPQPTTLRGLIQLFRSGILLSQDDYARSIDAVEESIRLLPGYSAPLLAAASIYAYANQPGKGADYFLRATKVDPDSARSVEDYEVNNIIRRLNYSRDKKRVDMLSDRLLEIGWIGSDLGSRSALARSAIERRASDGDAPGAIALVSKLLVPGHSYRLLANKQYNAVWPAIEAWGGPKLSTQWETYLREARDRWEASKDVQSVRAYSTALLSAGHDRTIIRDILPLFYKSLDQRRDQDLQFVVTGVAGALAREGKWDEVHKLFATAQKTWPLSNDNANALNVSGNWARYLFFEGRTAEALAKMDESLVYARKLQVNPDAIATMHHYRACMLHQLGRDSEAGVSLAITASVEFPVEAADVYLCVGNREAALRALIDGLEDENTRDGVLGFVQKTSDRPLASDYGRESEARYADLRRDPALLAEVAKYGRLLPFGANEGAPPEKP